MHSNSDVTFGKNVFYLNKCASFKITYRHLFIEFIDSAGFNNIMCEHNAI